MSKAVEEKPETENSAPEAPQTFVVVVKSVAEDGSISTNVDFQGVEATEVQTLLELGVRAWRRQIGL